MGVSQVGRICYTRGNCLPAVVGVVPQGRRCAFGSLSAEGLVVRRRSKDTYGDADNHNFLRYKQAMNRRRFLTQAASMIPAAAFLPAESTEPELYVKLDPTRTIAAIPADFIGLGYEISSVARPGLLSAQNSTYVQLVRTLGKCGVIRVGGNTSDYASYNAAAPAVSSPKGSVINQAVLNNLGTFLDATGA